MSDTSTFNKTFLPEEVGTLVVKPTRAASVALQVATVPMVDSGIHRYRVPIVASDPTTAWVAEGQEIAPSDIVPDEAETDFFKLAGLSIITHELATDSSPEARNLVGQALARDMARTIDTALFGTRGASSTQPRGLADTAPHVVTGAATWTDLDPFNEAIYDAEGKGATLTAWVTSPADALALANVKEGSSSNRTLLQPDPTQPTRRVVAGVPLYVSPAVTAGVVWGIPKDLVIFPMREDVTLDVDGSAFFTSDRVAIRSRLRVGSVFPFEAAIQKVVLGA